MKFLSKYLRLPETIWGVDTDEVFAYETNRKAWIRDRHLGVLYYFLITFILGWILGGQILWQNQHFVRRDVTGIQRMRSSHPTVNGCDPMDPHCQNNYLPIQDLPYCKDYKNTPWSDAAACRYEDNVAADPEGTVDNKLFFPTAVELVTEDLVDGQYVEDPGHNCLQSDYLCEGRGSQSNMFYYVADVAGFTVQFTSSYSRGSVQGSSLEEPGFFEICDAQLREEGDVKKWSTRLYDKHECVGEAVQEVPIPCQPGANCKELQKFDALKDTGENLKSRLKDSVHDLPGNLAMTQKRRSSSRAAFLGVSADMEATNATKETQHWASRDKLSEVYWSLAAFLGVSADRAATNATKETRRWARAYQSIAAVLGVSADRAATNATKETRRLASREPLSRVYRNQWGDVFSIESLLHLAGVDLDNDYNIDGWTTRQAGTVLEVTVRYNNLYPFLSSFGYTPVKYTYEVRELPMPYVSRMTFAEVQPAEYPKKRSYEMRYGVLIWFKVGGSIGFFSCMYLLVFFTAALGLVSVASTVTDKIGEWYHPNFFHLKFDVSPDFSDMWICDKCGYSNLEEDTHCQGVPSHMCPKTTPKCKEPRPAHTKAAETESSSEEEESPAPGRMSFLRGWRSPARSS